MGAKGCWTCGWATWTGATEGALSKEKGAGVVAEEGAVLGASPPKISNPMMSWPWVAL